MTADHEPELIAAAREAVEAGMQQATTYWQAAAANPGQGMEVRLPSSPGVVGLSYDLAPEPAPMPGNPSAPRLVPDYASDEVGGAIHLAGSPAARTQWAAGTTVTVLPGARSSLAYVGASNRQTWRARLRTAWAALLGRSR
jgi:hypothetical protein